MAHDGDRPLTAAVARLCARALPLVPDSDRAAVERIVEQLDGPLSLAVVGRTGAGKSTLVNALLGTAVCPVGEGETTRVVTTFSAGRQDDAELLLRTGERARFPLTSQGRLPERLPVRATEVERVDVRLAQADLRTVAWIDTPGLLSSTPHVSERTQRLMAESSAEVAHSRADGLLFVVNGPLRDEEADAARRFLEGSPAARIGGVIGVVGKVDQQAPAAVPDPDGDAVPEHARAIAAEVRGARPDLFSHVVPVIGLLASAVRCGEATEQDAAALAVLAAQTDELTMTLASVDQTTLASLPVDLDAARRVRLRTLFGAHGLRLLTAAARRAPGRFTAPRLWEVARRHSGYDELRATVTEHLAERRDLLQARRGLEALRAVAVGEQPSATESPRLRDLIETAEDDGSLLGIDLGEAAHSPAARRLPPELQEHLRDLTTARPGSPPYAERWLHRWREYALFAPASSRRITDTVTRTLAGTLSDGGPT